MFKRIETTRIIQHGGCCAKSLRRLIHLGTAKHLHQSARVFQIVLFYFNLFSLLRLTLTLFRMDIFGAAHGWGVRAKRLPLLKICHTYPTMMKHGTVIPYLRKIQKYMNYVTQHFSSAYISIFSPEISKFCYIKKYRYRLHFGT